MRGSDAFIRELVHNAKKEGVRIGVMTTEEKKQDFPEANVVMCCGRANDLDTVARGLYDALRSFDSTDVELVLCQTFSTKGMGEAIMNRLLKAAAGVVLTEKDIVNSEDSKT